MLCESCGSERDETKRKLCWRCTNWKRRYGTCNKEEVSKKKDERRKRLTCTWCGRKSTQVVPGAYTSTYQPMCVGCSWAAEYLKEALADPVKMYLLKEKLHLAES